MPVLNKQKLARLQDDLNQTRYYMRRLEKEGDTSKQYILEDKLILLMRTIELLQRQ